MINSLKKRLEAIAQVPPTNQPIVLGALLSRMFEKHGVSLTVVGGAAVQFYTQAEYVTHDLDAILHGDTKEIIEEVMGALGFSRTTMYRHFENPFFKFVVEFPPAPVEIGSRWITKMVNIQTEEGPVRMVRIEDIIMDRIVAWVEWKDQPSLDQAKLLWKKNKDEINKKYLKEFARKEGYEAQLRQIVGK